MGTREFRRRVALFLKGEKSLPGFSADNLRVNRKNLTFMDEPRFKAAWGLAKAANETAFGRKGGTPDIRWRAHVCCWAATNALKLKGDFVEFGVNAGLLSMTVCHYTDFETQDRKFWLFDTFEGIPTDGLEEEKKARADRINADLYSDVWDLAQRNFSSYSNAILVKG